MATKAIGENSNGFMASNPLAQASSAMLTTMADPEGGGGMNNYLMTQADPEGGGGIGGAAIGGGNFGPTTLAVGEEGGGMQIPPMSVTNAIGEDGQGIGGGFKPPNLETRAIPENGGGIGGGILNPGGGDIPPLQRLPGAGGGMTLAYPESGGGFNPPNMTTRLQFENGRPPMSVTQAVGEDGRFPPPMSGPVTQAIGEDGAIGSPSIPGQNPFDFSTFKSDLLTGIGDLFKKYFDETSSPFGGNEITPPPAPGETKPAMSPGDLVAPSSNYGSLASKGMQSPFRGI